MSRNLDAQLPTCSTSTVARNAVSQTDVSIVEFTSYLLCHEYSIFLRDERFFQSSNSVKSWSTQDAPICALKRIAKMIT